MTPYEFKTIREHLDLSKEDLAREFGYVGNDKNVAHRIHDYEAGKKQIPQYIARLLFLIMEHFDAEDGHLPHWPAWPVYQTEPAEV